MLQKLIRRPGRKIILPEININYAILDSNSSEKVKEDLLNHREKFLIKTTSTFLTLNLCKMKPMYVVNLAQL